MAVSVIVIVVIDSQVSVIDMYTNRHDSYSRGLKLGIDVVAEVGST